MWQLGGVESFEGFLVFSLLYSLVYSPTLSLTNSISFHHLRDRDRDFGKVRLWGTIGWIVVGIAVGQWLRIEHTPTPDEAAALVFEERVLDETARGELLTWSRVTLSSGSVVEGVVTPVGDSVRVEKQGQEPRLLSAEELASMQPFVEYLAAPGKRDELQRVAAAVEADPGRADEIRNRVPPGALFSEAALSAVERKAHDRGRADAFRLAALLGALLGVFCFFLPSTPPQKSKQQFATGKALSSIRQNPLLALFLLAIPVSCIHQFYFVHTAGFLSELDLKSGVIDRIFGVGGGGLMTIGQAVEIVVLALVPLLANFVSRKMFLAVGLLAYGLRMLLFAYAPQLSEMFSISPAVPIVLGIGLHGLCFGCFIFVAFMIVDEETSEDVRASAQSLFNLVIVGIGIIVGSFIASFVKDWATPDQVVNYTRLFSVPMWASFACLLALVLFYPGCRQKKEEGA